MFAGSFLTGLVGFVLFVAGASLSSSLRLSISLTRPQMFGAGLMQLSGTLFVAWLICAGLGWHIAAARHAKIEPEAAKAGLSQQG